jgi:hypothetical protein
MQKQLLIRLVVTALAAWPIAVIVSNDTLSLVWIGIVCWVLLYWLWNWGSGHGKIISRPLWRRAVLRIITLVAGAVALTVFMAVVMMILDLRHSQRQVRAERNKVRIGMTIGDVLPLVHGDMGIRAHAVLPDNVTDEELVHSANLMQLRDDTFVCSCGTKKELWRLQNLTESEAAELMKQKMSDGYEWRWRYTFVTATPRHFSFTVTFGRDGRVKDITDVWGWD